MLGWKHCFCVCDICQQDYSLSLILITFVPSLLLGCWVPLGPPTAVWTQVHNMSSLICRQSGHERGLSVNVFTNVPTPSGSRLEAWTILDEKSWRFSHVINLDWFAPAWLHACKSHLTWCIWVLHSTIKIMRIKSICRIISYSIVKIVWKSRVPRFKLSTWSFGTSSHNHQVKRICLLDVLF